MPPDLVLIVCDTARADAFSPWGAAYPTPAFDRLSREGFRWAEAISPAPWTLPAHASLFSGLLPTEHGVNAETIEWSNGRPSSPASGVGAFEGEWLPESLRRRGYRTWGASCNSWISEWGGFDRGFEQFLDLRPWATPTTKAARISYRARKALGRMDRGGSLAVEEMGRRLQAAGPEPVFLFLNLMETHSPFDPPGRYYPYSWWRRFQTRHLAGGPDQALSYNTGLVDPGPRYRRWLGEIYAGCARYEDHILHRLLGVVRSVGRPTAVAIVADHGENLGEHGLYNHNSSLHQTLLHVPMLAWGAGVETEGGVEDRPISTMRIRDWLLSVAEGPGPASVGGDPSVVVSEYEGTHRHNGIPESIRRAMEAAGTERVPPLVLQAGVALRRGPHKLLAGDDGRSWLFDLEADPTEDRDLLEKRPDLATAFRADIQAWRARRAAAADRGPVAPGQVAEGEIAEHLRELGYIE